MQGKKVDQCEDAYFIHERGFGVSDGVSGWNDYGFSSSAFSSSLMNNCLDEIEKCLEKGVQQKESKKMMKLLKTVRSFLFLENMVHDDDEEEEQELLEKYSDENESSGEKAIAKDKIEVHPLFVLDKAFARVVNVGSATAMVAFLNGRKLSLTNLGDSGFMIIRVRNGEAYTFAKS